MNRFLQLNLKTWALLSTLLFSLKARSQVSDSITYSENYKRDTLYLSKSDFSLEAFQNGDSIYALKHVVSASKVIAVSDTTCSGVFLVRMQSGLILYSVRLTRGVKDGAEERYFPNGKIKSRRYYALGSLQGMQSEYWENGNLLYDGYFIQGQEQLRICFTENRQIKSIRSLATTAETFVSNLLTTLDCTFSNGETYHLKLHYTKENQVSQLDHSCGLWVETISMRN